MTTYETYRHIVMDALETYRDTPPNTAKRRFVDWLMKKSLKATRNDPEEKKYHNLIVLRYISSTRRAKKPICDALHISRSGKTRHKGRMVQCYEAVTDNAIDRLLLLAFGVDGIDWGGEPAPAQTEDAAAKAPSEEGALLGRMAELAELKYSIVAGLLAGVTQHLREDTELSEDIRGGILEAIRTVQARIVLNAAFDPLLTELLFPSFGGFRVY